MYTKNCNKSNLYRSTVPDFALLNELISFFYFSAYCFILVYFILYAFHFSSLVFFIVTFLLFCYLLTRFFYLLVHWLTKKRMTLFLFILYIQDLSGRDILGHITSKHGPFQKEFINVK